MALTPRIVVEIVILAAVWHYPLVNLIRFIFVIVASPKSDPILRVIHRKTSTFVELTFICYDSGAQYGTGQIRFLIYRKINLVVNVRPVILNVEKSLTLVESLISAFGEVMESIVTYP